MDVSTLTVTKRVVRSTRGMVAAKHPIAAQAGADVLAAGGNAVDAAVTTAFVVGVVEPHMNGIGGGGYLTLHDQNTGNAAVVDYSMRSPRAATPDMYSLEEGIDPEAFGWHKVSGFANRVGHRAVAVPGNLAGLSVALQRFGTISLQRALQPAIEAASDGFPLGWYEAVHRGMQADELARDPYARRIYLESDVVRPDTVHVLRQPELAATLRQIAEHGPQWLYGGPLGQRIAAVSQANDGLLSEADFAHYEVSVQQSGVLGSYRGIDVIGRRAGTGAPNLVQLLQLLDHFDLASLGHLSIDYLHVYLEAARRVQADRLTYMADPERQRVPLAGLLSRDYAAQRAASIDVASGASSVEPGDPWAFDAMPATTRPTPAAVEGGGSTTALVAVDGNGVAVSITQTLMSAWGACVVAGDTGILLNNGMLWFDPEPGHANSIAGGQRALNNMCPVVLRRRTGIGPRTLLTVSASGGRRILHALAQVIIGVVDFGMDPQAAIAAPRVDASTWVATLDPRIGDSVLDALRQRGHQFTVVPDGLYPRPYASPVAIAVHGEELLGGVDVYHPAVAVGL